MNAVKEVANKGGFRILKKGGESGSDTGVFYCAGRYVNIHDATITIKGCSISHVGISLLSTDATNHHVLHCVNTCHPARNKKSIPRKLRITDQGISHSSSSTAATTTSTAPTVLFSTVKAAPVDRRYIETPRRTLLTLAADLGSTANTSTATSTLPLTSSPSKSSSSSTSIVSSTASITSARSLSSNLRTQVDDLQAERLKLIRSDDERRKKCESYFRSDVVVVDGRDGIDDDYDASCIKNVIVFFAEGQPSTIALQIYLVSASDFLKEHPTIPVCIGPENTIPKSSAPPSTNGAAKAVAESSGGDGGQVRGCDGKPESSTGGTESSTEDEVEDGVGPEPTRGVVGDEGEEKDGVGGGARGGKSLEGEASGTVTATPTVHKRCVMSFASALTYLTFTLQSRQSLWEPRRSTMPPRTLRELLGAAIIAGNAAIIVAEVVVERNDHKKRVAYDSAVSKNTKAVDTAVNSFLKHQNNLELFLMNSKKVRTRASCTLETFSVCTS